MTNFRPRGFARTNKQSRRLEWRTPVTNYATVRSDQKGDLLLVSPLWRFFFFEILVDKDGIICGRKQEMGCWKPGSTSFELCFLFNEFLLS